MDKSNVTAPAVNILETEDDFQVEVAAPGMTKEDFKVNINEDNELLITMEKKAEQKEEDKKHKGTYLRREFSYSQFQQSLILPDNVEKEKIAAKVEHGVLTVEIPKKKEVHVTPPHGRSRSNKARRPARGDHTARKGTVPQGAVPFAYAHPGRGMRRRRTLSRKTAIFDVSPKMRLANTKRNV